MHSIEFPSSLHYGQHELLSQVLSCADASLSSSSSLPSAVSRDERVWMEEVRCLALVNHRSVIRLVGVVTGSRPMYIVTELADRGSLKDCLRDDAGVFAQSDLHTLLDICTQVCSPLLPSVSLFRSSVCTGAAETTKRRSAVRCIQDSHMDV